MKREPIRLSPPSTIHLTGICGTGMGALAGLLKARGYTVRGSDANVYPPMSDELARLGIPIFKGYHAKNLIPKPDVVVVGNVCRSDHPEVTAARAEAIPMVSMPQVLHDLFLQNAISIVVAGTHGKTTTGALVAFVLDKCLSQRPSVLVGGVTADFGCGYQLGDGPYMVVEGDEYDSAFFQKEPKLLSYAPNAAIITSVEHDHIDIYPREADYFDAFFKFLQVLDNGFLAAYTGDSGVRRILDEGSFLGELVTYGVKGDPYRDTPAFLAHPKGGGTFELVIEGTSHGLFDIPLTGKHNLRNTLGAIAIAHRFAKIDLADIQRILPSFGGVARRQQRLGTVEGITVYDDFAHHPTAVAATIQGMKSTLASGKLIVAFEPRSATACRRFHQAAYATAFDDADAVIIAPVARDIDINNRLDTERLAHQIDRRGTSARAATSIDHVERLLISTASAGDTVLLLSNGAFGGVTGRILNTLKLSPPE